MSKLPLTCCVPAAAMVSSADSQVVNLEVGMSLGAFNIRVCDQTCTMADIKIRGVTLG